MIESLLIGGSGAIENSWEPIKEALTEYYQDENKMFVVEDDLNLIFSNLVQRLRWAFKLWRFGVASRNEYECFLNEYLEVKEKVALGLKRAENNNRIKLRPEYEKT